MTREALYAEAMRLPVEERRALARELLDDRSIDVDPMIDASHRAELDRRLKLIDAGLMEYSPWEEVEARIFGRED